MELNAAIRQNPMTRYQWLVVGICVMLTMIEGYEILITSFTLSALTEEWSLGTGQQGLVASFGALGMGFGAVFLGPLADRFGRRPHIIYSLIAITIAMVLAGLATSFEMFLGFRFLGGLFLGAVVPSINVLVAEYSNANRRGAIMGVFGIGLPAGAAIGGFLSVELIDAFTWRGPYFFSAIVTAIMVLVVIFSLPESVSYLVEKRPKGALAAYNKIALRMSIAPATELPASTAPDAKTTVVKGIFSREMLPRTLLLWLAYGTLIAAFYFANGLTAKLVTETTGDPDFGIRAQALVATGGVIGALVFALIARKLNPRLVTAIIMVFGCGVFFAFAAYFTNETAVMILAVMVGVAVNGGLAAYYAISPSIYPVAVRAAAIGLMSGLGRFIAFFAPNIATFLQGRGFSPADLYQLYGGVLVVSAIAIVILHVSYRGRPDAMGAEDQADLEASAKRALAGEGARQS